MITINDFSKKFNNIVGRKKIVELINSKSINGFLKGKTYYFEENELVKFFNIPSDYNKYLRKHKVSEKYNISGKTLSDYIKNGKFRYFYIGKDLFIHTDDVETYKEKIYEFRDSRSRDKKRFPEFEKRLKNTLGEDYEILESFKGLKTKILFKHKVCNETFKTAPESILYSNGQRSRGTRCPCCFGKNKLTQEKAEKLVYSHTNGHYKLIGKYMNNKSLVEVIHTIKNCKGKNKPFLTRVNSILDDNGGRCPYCSMSSGESKLFEVLSSMNINFKFQKTENINNSNYFFDFVLADNIYIEFDGEQHFREAFENSGFEEIIKRDKIKNQFIIDNNFTLIRISYKQIKNINVILKDILEDRTFRDYPLGEYEQVLGKSVILSENIKYIG